MALGLRKSGCSVGAVLAFWLGNPVLNPATMVFMGFVLGWHWVGLRLVTGVLLVFVVAYLVQWLVGDAAAPSPVPAIGGGSDATAAPAGTGPARSEPAPAPAAPRPSIWARWLRALGELSVGLVPEYVLLVLLLGAVRAWLFPAATPEATGVLWTIGLAVAGTLFVIPTAGEIPIVQTLMSHGLAAGPAAALLTTLPPVSLPSLAMLARAVPVRALVAVAAAVAALGVLSGGLAALLRF